MERWLEENAGGNTVIYSPLSVVTFVPHRRESALREVLRSAVLLNFVDKYIYTKFRAQFGMLPQELTSPKCFRDSFGCD